MPGSCAALPLDQEAHEEPRTQRDEHADERMLADLLTGLVDGFFRLVLTLFRLVGDDLFQGAAELSDVGAQLPEFGFQFVDVRGAAGGFGDRIHGCFLCLSGLFGSCSRARAETAAIDIGQLAPIPSYGNESHPHSGTAVRAAISTRRAPWVARANPMALDVDQGRARPADR